MTHILAFLAWVAVVAASDTSVLVQRSVETHQRTVLREETNTDEAEDAEAEEEQGDYKESEDEDEAAPGDWGRSTRVLETTIGLEGYNVSDSVQKHGLGPMVYTKLGPMLGTDERTHYEFKGIYYTEAPKRFEIAEPKKAWFPKIYKATWYETVCFGSDAGHWRNESEDCLNLDIWVPKGGHKNLPVLIYFHGGVNQHGYGSEPGRQGHKIINNPQYPVIFISFNWRMGLLGFFHLPGSGVTENLGMHDQQAMLRWVHENIAAFGGDPNRITIEGASEGCSAITAHMVSPGSAGLFSRAVLFSGPADIWSRSSSGDRTGWIVRQLGCERTVKRRTVRCLMRKPAKKLTNADWVSEEVSHSFGSPTWIANAAKMFLMSTTYPVHAHFLRELGWFPVVDNVTLFGEPRELIRRGKFNANITTLMTMGLNESMGVLPRPIAHLATDMGGGVMMGGKNFSGKGGIKSRYLKTIRDSGDHASTVEDVDHMMATDKMWTCDSRSLAADFTRSGALAYVGMFAHYPRFAPTGRNCNHVCEQGLAACHVDDMPYIFPQIYSMPETEEWKNETRFRSMYTSAFLAWIHDNATGHAWVPYDLQTQPITFYKPSGAFLVQKYRKEQCDILDAYSTKKMPWHMRTQEIV